jgi:hypothetical protein
MDVQVCAVETVSDFVGQHDTPVVIYESEVVPMAQSVTEQSNSGPSFLTIVMKFFRVLAFVLTVIDFANPSG